MINSLPKKNIFTPITFTCQPPFCCQTIHANKLTSQKKPKSTHKTTKKPTKKTKHAKKSKHAKKQAKYNRKNNNHNPKSATIAHKPAVSVAKQSTQKRVQQHIAPQPTTKITSAVMADTLTTTLQVSIPATDITYKTTTPSINQTTTVLTLDNATTDIKPTHPKKPSVFGKAITRLAQLSFALAVAIPTKSLTNFATINNFEKVMITDTLTIATSDEDTFIDNGHIHGYSYDVARRYAEHLGVQMYVLHFETPQDALLAVQLGQVDMLVGKSVGDNSISTSCNNPSNLTANFSFANKGKLYSNAKQYLCDTNTQQTNAQIAKFYEENLFGNYDLVYFDRVMAQRLPKYQHHIQNFAKKYNQDWRLLTAIAYQESHLDPNATSPTGVQGIMMLTESTAKAMGVTDRTDPEQSIHGGAKYLARLNKRFAKVPKDNRLFFVLSAYNMGPNAVISIQKTIAKQGGNPNSWTDFYEYLQANKHTNSRYGQCLQYVTNIRAFFEKIKSQNHKTTKNPTQTPK